MSKYVPVTMASNPWSLVLKEDLQSIRKDEKLTNQAVFMILLQLVEKANMKAGQINTSIMHVDFVIDYLKSINQKKRRPNSADYRFFYDPEHNERILVPILIDEHFFLACCEKTGERNNIYLLDSLFLKKLEANEIRFLVQSIDQSFHDAQVVFLQEEELQRQRDGTSCGVHVVIFAEKLIEVGLMEFRQNVPTFNIPKERHRLYKKIKNWEGLSIGNENEPFIERSDERDFENAENAECSKVALEKKGSEEFASSSTEKLKRPLRSTRRITFPENSVEMQDYKEKDPDYEEVSERTNRRIAVSKSTKKLKDVDRKRAQQCLSLKSMQNRYRLHQNPSSAWKELNRIRDFAKSNRENIRVLHEQLFKRMESVVKYWDEVQLVRIHDSTIKRAAIQHAYVLGIPNFKASKSWIQSFKKKLCLVTRHIDLNISKLTADNSISVANSIDDFKVDVLPSLLRNYKLTQIYNADQTGIQHEMTSNRTLTKRGQKKVARIVQRDYATKHSFTAHVVIRADGTLSKRLFLVLREPNPPSSFVSMVKDFKELDVHHTRSGMMTSDLAENWILSILPDMEERSVVIVDCWTGYKKMMKLAAIKRKKLKIVVLPKKSTSKLQPLDLFFNRHFKTYIRYVADYVLLNHPDFVLSQRKNIIAVLQFVWNQFKAPQYQKYGQYGWYLMGLLRDKPSNFQTPAQYCFESNDLPTSTCRTRNCYSTAFVKCSYCDKLYCFSHCLKHLH